MASKAEQQKARSLKAAFKKVNDAARSGLAVDTPTQLSLSDAIELWTNLNELIVKGKVGHRWQINIPAFQICFTEDDLTFLDADIIKQRTGARAADVELREDATHFAAVVYAWLVNHEGRDAVDAAKMTDGMRINDAQDCITTVAVGPDPKDRPASVLLMQT